MLRVAQGWYGSEWYGMGVGAVVETAQRVLRDCSAVGRAVWGESRTDSPSKKKRGLVKLLLR